MLILNRTVYTRVRQDYSWDFDEIALADLQKRVNECWISIDNDQAPQLTFDDIENIFNGNYDNMPDVFKQKREFVTTGKYELFYFIEDFLNNYIFDYWQGEEILENEDEENEVVRYEEYCIERF